jgi:hypothetical protein
VNRRRLNYAGRVSLDRTQVSLQSTDLMREWGRLAALDRYERSAYNERRAVVKLGRSPQIAQFKG